MNLTASRAAGDVARPKEPRKGVPALWANVGERRDNV
jgi:hypothetical protein